MRTVTHLFVAFVFISPTVVGAQTSEGQDLAGLWIGVSTAERTVTTLYGKEVPLTPFGLERMRTLNPTRDPVAMCLPMGPTRGYTLQPFQIVQSHDLVVVLFEYNRTFRMVYMDGRKPPEDIDDYPEWMGFSTGRWDGDTLVIETVAIDERTWLDTTHEHSSRLRLTERVRKVGRDQLEWTVTFDDPIFFTEPWSITRHSRRLGTNDRIMSHACQDNNKFNPDQLNTASK